MLEGYPPPKIKSNLDTPFGLPKCLPSFVQSVLVLLIMNLKGHMRYISLALFISYVCLGFLDPLFRVCLVWCLCLFGLWISKTSQWEQQIWAVRDMLGFHQPQVESSWPRLTRYLLQCSSMKFDELQRLLSWLWASQWIGLVLTWKHNGLMCRL